MSARAGTWRTDPATSVLHLDRQTDLLLQRFVDRDACLRPFGGRHDGELHVARRVTDDIHAGYTRFAEAVGLDRSLAGELATQSLRELRLLRLGQGEEHGATGHRIGAGIDECQSTRAAVLMPDALDALGADHDTAVSELFRLTATQTGRTIRAERDALSPRFQGERESS